MNYIPLYRKYRPQKLDEIIGQEHIKKSLTNAIELNKVSHAYLFTGPRGTGKTSTARILAKSLNCKEGPTVNPCGVCENCVNIANSTPIDVIEIDAASNRKVEDAQNILDKIMYAPVNSRYKIYIIDEVHMLSTTAFNALLKTLEEPPKNVIFILATTEVHKVLDTIKSRCQRFDFKRISTQDIVKHLQSIAEKENINITDDALNTIAKNSAGGMRDSLALLDQLSILGCKDKITTSDIENLLGRLSFDTLSNLSEKIINSNPQEAIKILEDVYNSGNEPVQILTNLTDYFKNLLIVKNCSKEIAYELTQYNDVQINTVLKQAGELETHQIVFLIDKSAEYIKELKLSDNPHLWLEVGIIDLSNITENTKLSELQERLNKIEGGNIVLPSQHTAYKKSFVAQPERVKQETTTHSATPKAELVQSAKDKDFSPMPKSKPNENDDLSVLWGKLLNEIKSTPTKALLNQWANPVKISPEETILTMKNEMFLNKIQNSINIVTEAVNTIFSQNDSKIIIRLAQAGESEIKPTKVKQTPKISVQSTSTPELDETAAPEPAQLVSSSEIPEITPQNAEEVTDKAEEEIQEKKTNETVIHSDEVNMFINLFDGKIIE